jgi:hypothetical protein
VLRQKYRKRQIVDTPQKLIRIRRILSPCPFWNYDADGRLLDNIDIYYTYDAAGRALTKINSEALLQLKISSLRKYKVRI